MTHIRVQRNTDIPTIRNRWAVSAHDVVTFQISKRSSFQYLAEGPALGFLASARAQGARILLELYKTPALDQENPLADIPEILLTPFGIELLRISDHVQDGTGAPTQLRETLGRTIWDTIKRQGGMTGNGSSAYFFSCLGYEIPECLRTDPSDMHFPRFDYFASSIRMVLGRLRGRYRQPLPIEEPLLEWLHEIAENAHQHGRFDPANGTIINGYQGFSVHKAIINKPSDISIRKDLPADVKGYLTRTIGKSIRADYKPILIVASVFDLGVGIQNTLPTHMRGHSELDTLRYAFRHGVTRHRINSLQGSGYGLAKALRSAANNAAYIYVASGALEAVIDLSIHDYARTHNDEPVFREDPGLPKSRGTSITIAWIA